MRPAPDSRPAALAGYRILVRPDLDGVRAKTRCRTIRKKDSVKGSMHTSWSSPPGLLVIPISYFYSFVVSWFVVFIRKAFFFRQAVSTMVFLYPCREAGMRIEDANTPWASVEAFRSRWPETVRRIVRPGLYAGISPAGWRCQIRLPSRHTALTRWNGMLCATPSSSTRSKKAGVSASQVDLAQIGVQHLARHPVPVADDEAAAGKIRIPADARQQFMDRDHSASRAAVPCRRTIPGWPVAPSMSTVTGRK